MFKWVIAIFLLAFRLGAGNAETLPSPPETPVVTAVQAESTSKTQPGAAEQTYETTVTAERPISAASSDTVRDRDFLLRPHARPADILQNTPGFIVVQHQGGGKANQYFLRGFDADHGTDVALFVDEVPINLPSHAHGQGYADLNWVIPELIERIDVTKGPYYARYGDFDTAGAFNLVSKASSDSSFSLTAGQFTTYRVLAITSPKSDEWKPLLAFEIYRTNGPFLNPENLNRYSAFAKISHHFTPKTSLAVALTSYGVGWHASGQIPNRLVESGQLNQFGAIDPTEGGGSQRHSLYSVLRVKGEKDSEFKLLLYGVIYRLDLYNNFTFFSVDPVNGDEIEQTDVRSVAGAKANYRFSRHWNNIPSFTNVGIDLRNDSTTVGLHHVVKRRRIGTLIDADIAEGSLSPYVEDDTSWTSWLRSVVGVRADYFGFQINNDRSVAPTTNTPKTSGVADATLISPKVNLIISPSENVDLFFNAGLGFHSNDARGVVDGENPVTPLTRAYGYEIGSRTKQWEERLDLAVAGFLIDLDSELTFDGDTGTTEASGSTRRYGIELEARFQLLSWPGEENGIFLDADATFVHAAYKENNGNGDALALAPTRVYGAGISLRHPSGLYGRVGLIGIGDRPASQDGFFTAEGFNRVDATVGYKSKSFELSVAFFNITNTTWREAQFDTISRLPNESGASSCPNGTRPQFNPDNSFQGCEDVDFTPGAPFNVQATATLFF